MPSSENLKEWTTWQYNVYSLTLGPDENSLQYLYSACHHTWIWPSELITTRTHWDRCSNLKMFGVKGNFNTNGNIDRLYGWMNKYISDWYPHSRDSESRVSDTTITPFIYCCFEMQPYTSPEFSPCSSWCDHPCPLCACFLSIQPRWCGRKDSGSWKCDQNIWGFVFVTWLSFLLPSPPGLKSFVLLATKVFFHRSALSQTHSVLWWILC